MFGRLRHEEDKFSGFDHQSIISFGIGHVFIKGMKHNLGASAGVGYKDLEDVQEAVFDGELKYAYKISETSEFNQNFFVESGSSNTCSKSETFLKLLVVGNLGAKFGYEVKHNTDVPVGSEKTDTITTVRWCILFSERLEVSAMAFYCNEWFYFKGALIRFRHCSKNNYKKLIHQLILKFTSGDAPFLMSSATEKSSLCLLFMM